MGIHYVYHFNIFHSPVFDPLPPPASYGFLRMHERTSIPLRSMSVISCIPMNCKIITDYCESHTKPQKPPGFLGPCEILMNTDKLKKLLESKLSGAFDLSVFAIILTFGKLWCTTSSFETVFFTFFHTWVTC